MGANSICNRPARQAKRRTPWTLEVATASSANPFDVIAFPDPFLPTLRPVWLPHPLSHSLEIAVCNAKQLREIGWGGRIRTYDTRYQKPLPYHLATPQNRVPELKVGDSMVQPPICRPELLFHLCSFWKSTHSFRTVRTLTNQTQFGGTSTLLWNGEFSLWVHIHQLSLRWMEVRASNEVTMSVEALWRLRAAQSSTAIVQAQFVQQCHNALRLRPKFWGRNLQIIDIMR